MVAATVEQRAFTTGSQLMPKVDERDAWEGAVIVGGEKRERTIG